MIPIWLQKLIDMFSHVPKKPQMRLSNSGLELIAEFEGFRSCPYKDAIGVPTIGFGNTYYPNGEKVRMTDTCITEERGRELLKTIAEDFSENVRGVVEVELNSNQFNALVSFAYNLGVENLKNSTLLKKVNNNPMDSTITHEFKRWVYADGKLLKGLVRRRKAEAELYVK